MYTLLKFIDKFISLDCPYILVPDTIVRKTLLEIFLMAMATVVKVPFCVFFLF